MALDDILAQVPIDDIAAKLGVSKEEAATAVQQGGAVLLGGLAKNAATEEGSTAIQNALKKHEGASAVSKVDDVDQADGEKIVQHVLGSDASDVASKLSASDKTAGIDFAKLLPILAPIIMGLLANKNKSSDGGESGGGIGGLIGGLLGGGSGSDGGGPGGGFGELLGGLLGGSDSNGGGLGGLIGGLFGKK